MQTVDSGQQEVEDETNPALPNLMEQFYYLEQSGVGLSREETMRVLLALKSLAESQPVETMRFWGKILGTSLNYYIAEVHLREGEGDDEEAEVGKCVDVLGGTSIGLGGLRPPARSRNV